MAADDAELARRWIAGETDAAAILVRRYTKPLFRFFVNKVDAGMADDLTQQTFETCQQRLGTIRDPGRFRSFLFSVAHNLLLMHYRRQRAGRATENVLETSVVQMGFTPSEVIARKHQERLLVIALRHLNLAEQIALELHFFEELRASDIAEILGEPLGTIKTRLRRAQGKLRDEIRRLERDPVMIESTISMLGDWARAVRDHVPSS